MNAIDASPDVSISSEDDIIELSGFIPVSEKEDKELEDAMGLVIQESESMQELVHKTIEGLARLRLLIKKDPTDLRLIGVLEYIKAFLEGVEDQADTYGAMIHTYNSLIFDDPDEGEIPL